MSRLLQTLACIIVAVCMASMSFAAAAHSIVIVDESAPHTSVLISEVPCPDCGTHQSVGCGQSCAVAAEDTAPTILFSLILNDLDHQVWQPIRLRGTALSPPITPPIV